MSNKHAIKDIVPGVILAFNEEPDVTYKVHKAEDVIQLKNGLFAVKQENKVDKSQRGD
jgi:hypothetical protein